MRSKYALASAVACVLAFGSTVSRAEKPATKGEKELVPESINRQFAWEEKVVGPKDEKRIDHAKIAALQSQAKKDAEKQSAQPTKKAERPQGVAAPASVVLPTMDIEKPAPAGSIKRPMKKTVAAEDAKPKTDALDALLAENRNDNSGSTASGDRSLRKTLAANSAKSSRNKKARHGKKARHRTRS
jgi:hypothetical protein